MFDLLIRNGTLVDGTGAAPRAADIAVRAGVICEVAAPGALVAEAAEELDATGLLVTPGFVDVHTHYDGQATWDPILAPSSWHGVTSVVMGNCGVGFAPVRPDQHRWLIELMEGVEDIPGSALSEGITWGWESFPEYLDALERLPRAIEIAAQFPHGALQAYVMGERGARNETPTADDIAAMARLVREGIEAGAVDPNDVSMKMLRNSYDTTFPLDAGPVFEPDGQDSIAARALRQGCDPDELVYDLMNELAPDLEAGKPGFLHVFFSGYKGGNLDDIGEMMGHESTVVGLADGGAHCSMICDASMPTFMLAHWVRDRSRGPRIPLEAAVRMLTRDPAELYDLCDRGTIEVGLRADLNVIDLDGLSLHMPEIVHDLPTGAPRLVQKADGYRATVVAGEVTFRDGVHTGATPGGLIRSGALSTSRA